MKTSSKNQLSTRPQASGARIIIDFLLEAGVDLVFGYPGGQVIPLYDALYQSGLRHILTRHEQGAIHAADGFARATGRTGVVFATSGPGATNLVTGLANAHMDSVPLVAITGQVPTTSLGSDSFQEADIYGISIPVTKYNYLVKKPETLPSILAEAFYLAGSGRPGPVLVDVPKDIQTAQITPAPISRVSIPGYYPVPEVNSQQIDQMLETLTHSLRPVIYLGGGASIAGVAKEILTLAEKCDIGVVSTLLAKGVFPGDHPLSLGLPGMHGTRYANMAIYESDLILALGVRFDDRVAGDVHHFAPRARIVHVDIDPAEIGKRLNPHISVVGDLKTVLVQALKKLKAAHRPEWKARIEKLKNQYHLKVPESKKDIKPQKVIHQISNLTKGEHIIVTDVGQHQMWAAQFIVSKKPRHFISSGGLGTMGYGLPAAIGAQLGCPDKGVLLITGDGSFQMNIQELATVRALNLPIKILLINNSCLGMVRQWQEFFYDRRYSETILDYNPDFVALAAAYNIAGRRITKPSDLESALDELLSDSGPRLLDVAVAREENVLPMIPAGRGQTDFYGEPEPTQ